MLLKPLALAATASGFLLIPELSETKESIFKALPIPADTFLAPPPEALSSTVNVPCKPCKGKDTYLKMDLTVEDGTNLRLNGYSLYPFPYLKQAPLTASVVRGDGEENTEGLDYMVAVLPHEGTHEDEMEVIDVNFEVLGVGNRAVKGLPAVHVEVVKTPLEGIYMKSVDMVEPKNKCHSMRCRMGQSRHGLMDMLAGWKSMLKGCSRHSQHHHHHHEEAGALPDDMSDDEIARIFGHGEGQEVQRNWGHLLKNIGAHIFLPVLMGLTAGVIVAFGATLICSALVGMTKLIRGDRRRSRRASRKARPNENASLEEKVGLMEPEAPGAFEEESGK